MENVGTIFYTAPVAPHVLINAFFLYSFLGWVMECIVIRREKGRWENRGFAHLPFCIIYGFGAMLGFALLRPFSGNYVLLYLVGAVLATLFEYLTARLMLRLFGTFWWDYTNKPFNYKGILCLESTLGWGLIALLLFAFLHRLVFRAVLLIPVSQCSFDLTQRMQWFQRKEFCGNISFFLYFHKSHAFFLAQFRKGIFQG